jgi:hypothetical protein
VRAVFGRRAQGGGVTHAETTSAPRDPGHPAR